MKKYVNLRCSLSQFVSKINSLGLKYTLKYIDYALWSGLSIDVGPP